MGTPRLRNSLSLGALFFACASCGPVPPEPQAGGGIGGTGSVAVVSSGPITGFGSVFVSDNEFDTTEAVITVDGEANVGESRLKKGMVVLVNGTVLEDYGTGQPIQRSAKTILYEDTIEGPVRSVAQDGLSLVVLGQTVSVSQSTEIDPGVPRGDLRTLNQGDLLEVSGFVTGPGTVMATRIDRKTGTPDYQVKGFITQHDKHRKSFAIGNLEVDYSAADVSRMPNPSDQTWDGLFVDARGAQVNQGGSGSGGMRLDANRVRPDGLGSDNDADAEIEGIVTSLISPTEFYVGNVHVRMSASTVFERGTPEDVAPGVRLEVEGPLVNSVLLAEKVEFKDSVKLEADVGALTTNTNESGTLTLVGLTGITVSVNGQTKIEGENALRRFSDLHPSDHVKIRGRPAPNKTITATELVRTSPASTVVLQGPLDDFANPRLTLLGISVDTSSIQDNLFKGPGGIALSRDAFFDLLMPQQVVELRGMGAGTLLSWKEARLHK